MAVITISRHFGAGGWTLGERLAKKFGYHYVNEGMITEVAAKTNVSLEQVRALEERGSDKLLRFLNKIVKTSYVERLTSDKYGFVDEKIYVDVVRKLIQELYEQGDVVIIGRGSQYILKGLANTWHILLVGDLQYRIRFVMNKYQLSESEAEKAIQKRDQTRTRFLNFFSEGEFHDDPLLYDLILNMSRLSLEKAEQLIEDLIFK